MHAALTADITPFTTRKPLYYQQDDRLISALKSLNVAIKEQRAAIARWRESLTELRGVMNGLGQGMKECQGSLQRLQSGVATLNNDAQAMVIWADANAESGVAPSP